LSKPTEPTEPSKPVDTNPIENPVNTDTGVVIVAVEDSKPIIQLADGTTKKVEAKEIGADVQKDGTVTVKGSDGKMKVLPKTGETENIALSVLGSLMVLGSAFIFKKRI
ncbi:TPA: LPXTG cell wall anchor domain-containing protein, partial [Clostridioides difficile]|nr:LPXTG cell wall anchor domain-containing protein [Clostridioides difficile]